MCQKKENILVHCREFIFNFIYRRPSFDIIIYDVIYFIQQSTHTTCTKLFTYLTILLQKSNRAYIVFVIL